MGYYGAHLFNHFLHRRQQNNESCDRTKFPLPISWQRFFLRRHFLLYKVPKLPSQNYHTMYDYVKFLIVYYFFSGLLVTVLFLRTEDKKADRRLNKKAKSVPQDINKDLNVYTNSALSVSVTSHETFNEDLLDKPAPKGYSKKEIFKMTKSFFVLFFYRVVRLTPAYAFVIGINELALRYTHDHTVFEPAMFDHINCERYWWRNLLYINNFFPQKEMCMVWSWYMANDTQFYVIGVILLLISVK